MAALISPSTRHGGYLVVADGRARGARLRGGVNSPAATPLPSSLIRGRLDGCCVLSWYPGRVGACASAPPSFTSFKYPRPPRPTHPLS